MKEWQWLCKTLYSCLAFHISIFPYQSNNNHPPQLSTWQCTWLRYSIRLAILCPTSNYRSSLLAFSSQIVLSATQYFLILTVNENCILWKGRVGTTCQQERLRISRLPEALSQRELDHRSNDLPGVYIPADDDRIGSCKPNMASKVLASPDTYSSERSDLEYAILQQVRAESSCRGLRVLLNAKGGPCLYSV